MESVEGWKVVVTDKFSLKVLNACCRMDEIGDLKVSRKNPPMKESRTRIFADAVF